LAAGKPSTLQDSALAWRSRQRQRDVRNLAVEPAIVFYLVRLFGPLAHKDIGRL
jgi:hypothetical protein